MHDRSWEWQPQGFQVCHHSALFRYTDGVCIDGPCKGARLDALAVCVEDGQVKLKG